MNNISWNFRKKRLLLSLVSKTNILIKLFSDISWLLLGTLLLISVSSCFIFLTHPLAIGFTLITQTILICLVVALSSKLSWFSYILFLIFLGATLVLFIYVAALASNETFKLSFPITGIVIVTLSLAGIFLLFREQSIFIQSSLKDIWLVHDKFSSTHVILSNIYSYYNLFLTGLVILYLLLTLLVVVGISSTFFGPLRLS